MRRETPSLPAPPPTVLALGFRFHPTDKELVIYYLKHKVCGEPFRNNAISEVDIYKSEPWDLAGYILGRAQGGLRTNWVMHEYRLVDEELEKARVGATMQDSYVLCRVFLKNNIGPLNSHRYAPFIEKEWDDSAPVLLLGEQAGKEVVAVHNPFDVEAGYDAHAEEAGHDECDEDAGNVIYAEENGRYEYVVNGYVECVEGNNFERDTQSINGAPLSASEVPRENQNALVVCKSERMDDYPSPCLANPRPSPLLRYKKRRNNELNSNHSNGLETSTRTSQDHCSSTTTTTTAPATRRNFLSKLEECFLLEYIEPKDSLSVSPLFDIANLDSSVPPSCLKFIQDLRNEMHKISVERETLKSELRSAQTVFNILQCRIDLLNKENEDLKRSAQDVK
ncbi:NAC domain containing protein 50-like [Quercus lobata]|uniref:NAC domain-containing protein n=1 Tax=Quercus lobata TaxID=97700 RepID=A0A7N2R5Y1_QUELO|nr:NAC domain containing protein 50-like [Quercus lobata]